MLETNKGNFDFAIAIGLILLVMSFIVNLALTYYSTKNKNKLMIEINNLTLNFKVKFYLI